MSCQVEQIADCGDISSLGRALFISDKEDSNWLPQCAISLSSCSNLLAVGCKSRLCLLTNQWISSTDSNTFLISWSGTLPSDITALLALPICPSQQSSQNGPDWFCIIVGFMNGSVGFYSNTGHLLLLEKLDDKPVKRISCHTGTYGTLPDDVHVLYPSCECIISGSSLFQVLRNAKAQLAKVRAGLPDDYSVDSRNINIRKWMFSDQDVINNAAVVGLDLKNTYDHLLAASTYGGYDVWYRSVPPVNSLILGAGAKPYVGFHYALEGGTAPPLQDVARAVANKIKSALPGWLGGGNTDNSVAGNEPLVRSESLSMRNGLYDGQRHGNAVAVSPDRRLAAIVDNFGRVAVLDVTRGHLIRLFKGYRDAQCAFVQIFEDDDKKPQLSVVKDLKRAIFLIIYNPKKGLIDIRLMQRGNRVAAFTATKNGLLLYNTCGLVGAEKNYSSKKLNLPEFQCVLIDPDGKLKKFVIPFFYALEGEHSERSKDLHALRDLREHLKKISNSHDYVEELIKKASELQTLDLKKHCLDLLVRKYDVPPKIIMSCLEVFWDSIKDDTVNQQDLEIKQYFANIGLLTLFFRNINCEDTDDMQQLADKIRTFLNNNISTESADVDIISSSIEENSVEKSEDTNQDDSRCLQFDLLEDDNCILERLLTLAQENNYKEHHHARVTFADNTSASTYKEFVSCFKLDEKTQYVSLKSDASAEKINNLASIIFKSIFQIKDTTMLTSYVKDCNMDPKEIVKLLIMHLMNMPLAEINIELIEKFIKVLYYVCSVTEEAMCIAYNEISPWWQAVRDILVEMSCPLRSLIVAMACKAVSKIFETICQVKEEDIWESVTKENAKWGILIGKLEDISILSIILMFNETPVISKEGNSILKLPMTEFNINLKYIYTRGKGSVTELIAKWLCGMGVIPEAVVADALIDKYCKTGSMLGWPGLDDDEDGIETLYIDRNRIYIVDENPKIFKWLSLLRQQFPLSTSADYIIANMCWEYAMAWQKSMQNCEYLKTVLRCLACLSNQHIRLGLFSIIWSTYIKHVFEVSCRLVNKVGRLPKDPLCLQDVGFDSTNMIQFLETTTKYLDEFLACSNTATGQPKQNIQFEKIWDESTPSLVEVAQDTKNVDNNILNLNHQISCTVYYMSHFNIKMSKPLDSLYDIDYQYILEALASTVTTRELNMKASDKLRNPRMKFLTKLIRAAVETISISESIPCTTYNCEECVTWMENITILSEIWNMDKDFVRRQQIISLYHLGYDSVAENIIHQIEEPEVVLVPILAITTQRFKRNLEHSSNQPEWIVSLPPQLFKRIRMTELDTSIPAHPSLETTKMVLQKVLTQMEKKSKNIQANIQNIKMAELFIESCDVLIRRKL